MNNRHQRLQKLLHLRLLQERLEEEKVSLSNLQIRRTRSLIATIESLIVTAEAEQARCLLNGDSESRALAASTGSVLRESVLEGYRTLELNRLEYARHLEAYLSARSDRAKAACVAESSSEQQLDRLSRREQAGMEDLYLAGKRRRL